MDELQERAEIDRLVEEQLRDDTYQIAPEVRDMVPFDEGLHNRIGVTLEGEIEWFDHVALGRVQHGKVLVGTASWHGTFGGYTNHKCRCCKCKGANATHQRKVRAAKREAA